MTEETRSQKIEIRSQNSGEKDKRISYGSKLSPVASEQKRY